MRARLSGLHTLTNRRWGQGGTCLRLLYCLDSSLWRGIFARYLCLPLTTLRTEQQWRDARAPALAPSTTIYLLSPTSVVLLAYSISGFWHFLTNAWRAHCKSHRLCAPHGILSPPLIHMPGIAMPSFACGTSMKEEENAGRRRKPSHLPPSPSWAAVTNLFHAAFVVVWIFNVRRMRPSILWRASGLGDITALLPGRAYIRRAFCLKTVRFFIATFSNAAPVPCLGQFSDAGIRLHWTGLPAPLPPLHAR